MFVVYNGTTPVAVIQVEGNQIKVGVPVGMAARELQPEQPAPAVDAPEGVPVQRWKIPVPSLN